MKVIQRTADLAAGGRPVCLAIGVFDGVHLGHQEVIRQAVEDAARLGGHSGVITFDRHPASVLAPAHAPPLIYPLEKKLRAISALGPDTACVIHFDKAFSEISGGDFVQMLARDAGRIGSLSVGRGFVFGKGRSGDVALLRTMGEKLGFAVHALEEVSLHGHPVSSTRVREALRAGHFGRAAEMLARPYELCGRVVKGAGLGRKIGVPTANLGVAGLLTPPSGVYAANASFGSQQCLTAVNIGCRPTVGSDPASIHVEAHLLDFSGDVYGMEMDLALVKKLRDEQKFPSLAALCEQIQMDIARTRALAQES